MRTYATAAYNHLVSKSQLPDQLFKEDNVDAFYSGMLAGVDALKAQIPLMKRIVRMPALHPSPDDLTIATVLLQRLQQLP